MSVAADGDSRDRTDRDVAARAAVSGNGPAHASDRLQAWLEETAPSRSESGKELGARRTRLRPLSYPVEASRRRVAPLAIAARACALTAGLLVGEEAALAGAVAFLLACAAALRDTTSPVLTWRAGISPHPRHLADPDQELPPPGGPPVRARGLPTHHHRADANVAGLGDRSRRDPAAGGHGRAAFPRATTIAALGHIGTIRDAGLQADALKSRLARLPLAFVLVCSTIESMADVDAVIIAIVLGGSIVADRRHLRVPLVSQLLQRPRRLGTAPRLPGRGDEDLRASASSARSAHTRSRLGAALAMCVPSRSTSPGAPQRERAPGSGSFRLRPAHRPAVHSLTDCRGDAGGDDGAGPLDPASRGSSPLADPHRRAPSGPRRSGDAANALRGAEAQRRDLSPSRRHAPASRDLDASQISSPDCASGSNHRSSAPDRGRAFARTGPRLWIRP